MKTRESGMPEEAVWSGFFDVEKILDKLGVDNGINILVDLGSGYGTFTIPAARRIGGQVYAYEIESHLATQLKNKLAEFNIKNVEVVNRDFVEQEPLLEKDTADYVFLFNILHAEEAPVILKRAYDILRSGGRLGVIHWLYDEKTPRGPSMEIRPKPENLKKLIKDAEFKITEDNISLPPYHYGITGIK